MHCLTSLSVFSGSRGWRLTWNDTDCLIREGEAFANNKLEDFREAAEKKNATALKEMTKDLLNVVKNVQKNNDKLLPRIIWVVDKIKSLSDKDLNGFFAGRFLHLFVAGIDGNRDNYSYYWFDAAAKWIERRLNATSDTLKTDMTDSRNMIIDARDDLDSHAQIFVQGVKKIRELASGGNAGENASEIRKVVQNLQLMKETIRLTEKTQASIDKIQEMINNTQDVSNEANATLNEIKP